MATPTEWLNEFQVNTGAAVNGLQDSPRIIGLSNGNFLVAWEESGTGSIGASPGSDIIAKIYDPEGDVVLDSFQINSTSFVAGGNANAFDIAPTNDGGFILVYSESSIDLVTASAVRWDRFTSGGFRINTAQIALENSAGEFFSSPQVAVDLTDNTSVVTFQEGIGNTDIRGRTLSAMGTFLSNEFEAAQNSPGFDRNSDVAILSNGNYVSVYEEEDGITTSIEFRIFEPNGSAVDSFTQVAFTGINPEVASLTNGNFVVTWQDNNNIRYRIYGETGNSVTGILTAQATVDTEINPQVVALQDGDFVIVWDNETTDMLQAQRFNANGTTDGGVFTVENATTSQANIGVAGDGRILFTWETGNGLGEIFASVWDPRFSFINATTYDIDRTNFVQSTVITSRTSSSTVVGDISFETILGQAGNDVLAGGSGADTISGGDGGDVIQGGSGLFVDTIDAGPGDDTIIINNGEFIDNVDGGSGTDTLDLSDITNASGAASVNLITGIFEGFGPDTTIANVENVIGTQQNDTIIGQSGSNTLEGQDGNDTLEGGFGVDTIDAGSGDDTIIINNVEFIDNVDGGSGTDTLDLSDITNASGAATVNLTTGVFEGFGPDTTIANVEDIIGTQQADVIFGNNFSNVLEGQDGDDTLTGSGGNDTIIGGSGADTLNGSNDTLTGMGEIDIINPGDFLARDVIILGDSDSLYYSDPGVIDYAVIVNFDRLSFAGETDSDIIQIRQTPGLTLSPFDGIRGGISITNGTRIHAGGEDIAFVDSHGLLSSDDLTVLQVTT